MTTLQNKTIVIVGGSSGIGFGVALAALQSLASVVIIASSNADRVKNAVERLRAHKLPGKVRGEVLDAKDSEAVKNFAVRLGTVDHVAWTSGDVPTGLFDPLGKQGTPLTEALAVRWWGFYILAQNIKIAPGGSLTVTSGTSDIKPRPNMNVPAGACAALEGLARSLAVDLAPVRVNVVSPGGIETEIWDRFPQAVKDKFLDGFKDRHLIKRIGTPAETAEAYLFLMKCGYITGQRINVDGGVSLA